MRRQRGIRSPQRRWRTHMAISFVIIITFIYTMIEFAHWTHNLNVEGLNLWPYKTHYEWLPVKIYVFLLEEMFRPPNGHLLLSGDRRVEGFMAGRSSVECPVENSALLLHNFATFILNSNSEVCIKKNVVFHSYSWNNSLTLFIYISYCSSWMSWYWFDSNILQDVFGEMNSFIHYWFFVIERF